jgi:hypothetical protein
VKTTANVTAPASYPAEVRATGLPNPWFYGNGQAKGYAEFFNGLIKFNGFYLNTDGFLSSDKVTQDAKTYHNYSYVLESEKSLSDYENTMKDIVHPVGMSMLGRTITFSDMASKTNAELVISTIPFTNANALMTVSNSYNVVVTGTLTYWATDAAANDILMVVDPVHPLRSQAKIIKIVTNNTSLNVESNFIYVGQGRLQTNASNNLVVVSGNANLVSDFLQTNDVLRMNVNNTIITRAVTGISGNVLTLNTTISTSNTGVLYHVVPVYTSVDYEIIKVE